MTWQELPTWAPVISATGTIVIAVLSWRGYKIAELSARAAQVAAEAASQNSLNAVRAVELSTISNLLDGQIQYRVLRIQDLQLSRINSAEMATVRSIFGNESDESVKAYLWYAVEIGLLEKRYLAIKMGAIGAESILSLEEHVMKLMQEERFVQMVRHSSHNLFLFTTLVREVREYLEGSPERNKPFQIQSLRQAFQINR